MFTFDKLSRIELEEATEFLINRLPFINSVDLVIQLGSGQVAENILEHEWDRVSLREMPHLPTEESIAKHKLEIIWGTFRDFKILIYTGRFHLYEGYGRVPCILPIWAAVACGARNFFLANAARALNESLTPGGFMIFSDHINNLGESPLSGHQHLLDSPYVDMSQTYAPELADSFIAAAGNENVQIQRGIYMANKGPQFETPAEIRYAKMLGADAVGMSTVLEATTAHALKAKVLGISMLKDSTTGTHSGGISNRKAFEVGKSRNKKLIASIRRWLTEEAESVL
jgi:purine-nucleoside phosphorylase